jgi:hypothetical protein
MQFSFEILFAVKYLTKYNEDHDQRGMQTTNFEILSSLDVLFGQSSPKSRS